MIEGFLLFCEKAGIGRIGRFLLILAAALGLISILDFVLPPHHFPFMFGVACLLAAGVCAVAVIRQASSQVLNRDE